MVSYSGVDKLRGGKVDAPSPQNGLVLGMASSTAWVNFYPHSTGLAIRPLAGSLACWCLPPFLWNGNNDINLTGYVVQMKWGNIWKVSRINTRFIAITREILQRGFVQGEAPRSKLTTKGEHRRWRGKRINRWRVTPMTTELWVEGQTAQWEVGKEYE